MNGIFGVISAKFCIFDIASFFAVPPNSASYGLLEEFLFIFQRYKISTTLTNNLLERCQHFTTVPIYHDCIPDQKVERCFNLYSTTSTSKTAGSSPQNPQRRQNQSDPTSSRRRHAPWSPNRISKRLPLTFQGCMRMLVKDTEK